MTGRSSYKYKSKYKSYSKKDVELAVRCVVDKTMSLTEAAKLYGVPRTTLSDKANGRTAINPPRPTILTKEEEDHIVSWLQELSRKGIGCQKDQLLTAVHHIMKDSARPNPFTDDKPGIRWYRSFLERHPKVVLKRAQGIGHHKGIVTEHTIRSWFRQTEEDLKGEGIEIRGVTPDCIFNCDETGFPFPTNTDTDLVFENDKLVYSIKSDSKQQMTVLACASAAGTLMKPLIIHPHHRFYFNPEQLLEQCEVAHSSNGWINSDIFHKWIKESFIPFTEALKKPVILFIDGNKSPISLRIHNLFKEANIVYYTLPTHTSHIMHPLNLVLFKAIKSKWTKAVNDYINIPEGHLTKDSFGNILKDAWKRASTPTQLSRAFETAGLYPWNPDGLDFKKYAPSTSEESLTAAKPSSTSVEASTASSSQPSPASNLSLAIPLSSPTPQSSMPSSKLSLSATSSSQNPSSFPAAPSSPTLSLSVTPLLAMKSSPSATQLCALSASLSTQSSVMTSSSSATPSSSMPSSSVTLLPTMSSPSTAARTSNMTQSSSATSLSAMISSSLSSSIPASSSAPPPSSTMPSLQQATTSSSEDFQASAETYKQNLDKFAYFLVKNQITEKNLFGLRRQYNENKQPSFSDDPLYWTYVNLYDKLVSKATFSTFTPPEVKPKKRKTIRIQLPHFVTECGYSNNFKEKDEEETKKKEKTKRKEKEKEKDEQMMELDVDNKRKGNKRKIELVGIYSESDEEISVDFID